MSEAETHPTGAFEVPADPVVSVVVPVYYNEGSLLPLFEELLRIEAELEATGAHLELVFVDDGSGDASLNVLVEMHRRRPTTQIIKLTRNFGAMAAAKLGLRFTTGNCVLFLAADLQDPPDLILRAFAEWKKGASFVVCNREARDDPPSQRLFAAIYYAFLRATVTDKYPRGGFDLFLMDRALVAHILNSAKNVNISLFAFWLGYTPVCINYRRRERTHGKSRWTFRKRLNLFIDSILGFSMVPIRTISLLGVFVACCSFTYGTVVVVSALLGLSKVQGFAAIASLVSFLLGMVLVLLGIVGEYVWRIYSETTGLPESVVERVWVKRRSASSEAAGEPANAFRPS